MYYYSLFTEILLWFITQSDLNSIKNKTIKNLNWIDWSTKCHATNKNQRCWMECNSKEQDSCTPFTQEVADSQANLGVYASSVYFIIRSEGPRSLIPLACWKGAFLFWGCWLSHYSQMCWWAGWGHILYHLVLAIYNKFQWLKNAIIYRD